MELFSCEKIIIHWYEVLSWTGTLILIIRAFPQAYQSWKDGHSDGLNQSTLWLWLIGSLLVLPHLIVIGNLPSIIVYLTNVILVSVMLKYSYFKRKEK